MNQHYQLSKSYQIVSNILCMSHYGSSRSENRRGPKPKVEDRTKMFGAVLGRSSPVQQSMIVSRLCVRPNRTGLGREYEKNKNGRLD